MLKKFGRITLILALLLPFTLTHRAYACSCEVYPLTLDNQEFDTAQVIFYGAVTDLAFDSPDEVEGDLLALIDVGRVFRGEVGEVLYARTPIDDGLCGVSFEIDRTYLFYSRQRKFQRGVEVGLCNGVIELDDVAEAVAKFGEGGLGSAEFNISYAPLTTPEPTATSLHVVEEALANSTTASAPSEPVPSPAPDAAPAPTGSDDGAMNALMFGVVGALLILLTIVASWRK